MRAFLISQQSRFLALVSNYSRLAELTEEAANSQDAGTLQYLKTLDSIESKLNQLQVAFQEFYTSMGLENVFKGALDMLTGFITQLNSLPKIFGTIPDIAIGMGANLVIAIKNILNLISIPIFQQFQRLKAAIAEITGSDYKLKFGVDHQHAKQEAEKAADTMKKTAESRLQQIHMGLKADLEGASKVGEKISAVWNNSFIKSIRTTTGTAIKAVGATAAAVALTREDSYESMQTSGREWSKVNSGVAGGLGNIVGGLLTGGLAGGLIGLIQSIPNIRTLVDGLNVTTDERIAQLNKEIETQKNQVIISKNTVSSLESEAQKLKELQAHRYDSAEANQAYIDYMNQLAETHSDLIESIDAEGNSIVSLEALYRKLIHTRATLSDAEYTQMRLEALRSKEYATAIQQASHGRTTQTIIKTGTVGALQSYNTSSLFDEQFFKDYNNYSVQEILTALATGFDKNGAALSADSWRQLYQFASMYTHVGLDPLAIYGENSDAMMDEVQRIIKRPDLIRQSFTGTSSLSDLINTIKNTNNLDNEQANSFLNILKQIGIDNGLFDSAIWQHVFPDLDSSAIQETLKSFTSTPEALQYLVSLLDLFISEGERLSEYEQTIAELDATYNTTKTALSHWAEKQTALSQEDVANFQGDNLVLLLAEEQALMEQDDEGWQALYDFYLQNLDSWGKLSNILFNYQNYGNISDIFADLEAAGLDTTSELGAKLTEIIGNKWFKDRDTLADNYTERITQFLTNYGPLLQGAWDSLNLDNVNADLAGLPLNQWNKLTDNYFSLIESYINQGLYTQAQQLFDAYTAVIELFKNSNLNTTDLNYILSQFTSTDLNDRDAIQNTIDTITAYGQAKNIDVSLFIAEFSNLRDALTININTELQNYIDNLKKAVEASNKLSSNAVKGLDYDDMSTAIASLTAENDLSAEEAGDLFTFNQESGKFIYTTKGFLLAQAQVLDEISKQYDELNAEIEQRQGTLDTLSQYPVAISNAISDIVNETDEVAKKTRLDELQSAYGLSDNAVTLLSQAIQSGVQTQEQYEEWLANQDKELAEQLSRLEWSEQLAMQQLNYDNLVTTFNSIDFASIVAGTSDQEAQMQQIALFYASKLKTNNEQIIDHYSQKFFDSIAAGGQQALTAYTNAIRGTSIQFDYDTAKTLFEGQMTHAADALSELYAAQIGDVLSKETNNLLASLGINDFSVDELGVVGGDLTEATDQLYQTVIAAFEAGEATVAQVNAVAQVKLRADREKASDALDIFSKGYDLTEEDLTRYAELIGQPLYQLMGTAIEYIDGLGYTINITEADLDTLGLDRSSKDFIEAWHSRNDKIISAEQEETQKIVDEVNNLTSAKIGDKLNLTYIQSKFGDFGGQIVDGILTITEDTNILQLATSIRAQMEASGQFLQSDIVALGEALDNLLKSYASLISGGIQGSLSQTDAANLKGFAKNSLGVDIDFTRTKNGLKLSTDQAGKLYQELKKVDGITAQLVFDDLVESLSEAGSGFENISQTMARIAETQRKIAEAQGDTSGLQEQLALYQEIARAQSDNPDSFSFMDNSIPAGMQGPENYWNAVGTAFKVMNQAGQSGYMEIQDFYNITQEMKNLAIMSGNDLQFMGQTIYADGSGAAELIQMAMSALSNIDGEGVKVDFSKLGQSFSGGAADMASGFDDAVKTMAKAQIEMLDAEIAMLEAIVAMEKLGDIDVDQNGVFSIGDIFTGETEWDEQSQQFLSKFTTEYQTFAQDLLEKAESDEELKKALDEVIINEHTLREYVEDATDGLKNLDLSEEEYFATLDALVQAAQSGDYDPEHIATSIAEVWSKTGQVAKIKLGDKEYVIGYGVVLTPDKDGNYTVNGQTYSDPETALQALTLSQIDGVTVQVDETTGEVTGELTIDQTKFEVNPLPDGSVEYTVGNFTTTSKEEAYHQAYLDYKEHAEGAGIPVEDEVEWQMRVLGHVVVGEVTIANPDAFKTRMHEDVVALAEKLNSGTDEEIVEYAAKLGIQVDYSDTLGLTEEQRQQIAELAGIESKVVTEDIAINITGEDAENTKKLLSDEPLDKVVNLQLQRGEGTDPVLAELLDNQTTPTQRSMEVDVTATGEFTTSFVDSLNNLNAENLEIVVTKLAALSSSTRTLQQADFSNIDGLKTQWEAVLTVVQEVSDLIASLTEKTFTVNVETSGVTTPTVPTPTNTGGQTTPIPTGGGGVVGIDASQITVPGPDIKEWTDAATAVSDASVTAASGLTNVATPLEKMPDVSGRIDSLVSAMQKIPTYAASRVAALASSMAAIQNKVVTHNHIVKVHFDVSSSGSVTPTISHGGDLILPEAKGNVALAGGSKRTLVGELGPELVVSRGHYYVVGQNGAEFVDLDKDAIVFNHLQTKKLLGSGRASRGTAITNERNAVSWATGNTSGPAMASASEALALLKQIRAMWQSLLGASLKDLGGLAGRGGGGGGGGGGNTKFSPQIGTFERWYNLMRQIADLEQKITLEEAKRKNMRNGADYSRSLQKELAMLQTQLADQKELNYLQQDYLKHEIEDFNKTEFTKIFTFTQDGLMQLVDGPGRGLDVLSKLTATDENGRLIRKLDDTAANQLKYFDKIGFDYSAFSIDEETGKKLDPATEEEAAKIMEHFWDRLQYYLDNIDGLRDTIADGLVQEQELLTKIAEIQQEYIDNQLKLEQNLVKAIEDRQQAIIDGLTDEKDAIQEATQAYIDGLSDALQRERDMYQKNQTQQETLQLQRQLAILQRSGGSAADIKNLQDQINGRLQDRYFDAQQEQIDAVQAASDREIERLDYQIELMTEALEYQKENGILWNEVYQMLEKWTPEQMVEFYERYTKEYQSKSALDKEQSSQEVLREGQMFTQNRDASAGWAAYSATLPSRNVTAAAGYDMAAIEAAYKSAHGTGGAAAAQKAADAEIDRQSIALQRRSRVESQQASGAYDTDLSTLPGSDASDFESRRVAFGTGKTISIVSDGTAIPLLKQPTGSMKDESLYLSKGTTAFRATAYLNDDPVKWIEGKFTNAQGKEVRGWFNMNAMKSHINSASIDALKKQLKAFGVKNIGFSTGGLDDFTGLAMLHGTKRRPEAVLNADQTAFLREDLLGKSRDSLMNIVRELQSLYSSTRAASMVAPAGDTYNFENVSLNFEPGTISNDYSARRAGEQVWDELLSMARKSGNVRVSRR